MNTKRIDIGVGSTLSVFSIIIFLYSNQYKKEMITEYGANFFPQVLSVLMFTLSILLIIKAFKGEYQQDMEGINKTGFIRSAITLGISIIYLLLMQLLGFFLSTFIFLFVLMTYIGHKGKVIRFVTCLGVSLAVYGIFYFFLKIPLPEGIFFNLL